MRPDLPLLPYLAPGAKPRMRLLVVAQAAPGQCHEVLMPWVDVVLSWVYKYYKQMDDNNVYIVTMCECLRSTLAAHLLYFTRPSPQPHNTPDMD